MHVSKQKHRTISVIPAIVDLKENSIKENTEQKKVSVLGRYMYFTCSTFTSFLFPIKANTRRTRSHGLVF